jgi:acylphosphatase
MTQKIQIRVKIMGRVQGVCFRAKTKKEADRLGLKGWVRNQSGGSVEAVFEGNPASIAQMMGWCRKGPALSRVDQVQTETQKTVSGFTGFDILY